MDGEARWHFEDFPVGRVIEFGSKIVSREEMLAFARQFDPQPFHMDEEAAARSLYGGLIASGWHTCAMAMRMYVDAVMSRSASQGSPGIDRLRWLRPVRPGDVLRVRIQVQEARPSGSKPHLGLIRNGWQVLNQAGEVVLEMDGWSMLRRRAAG